MADGGLGRRSGEEGADELEAVLANKGPTNDQNSAFQTAVAAWRNIDLTTLQKSLDSAANDIVVSQRDGLIERKELASKTKEFRKLDEEGRANEWKGLLKSYQTYIDHLTNSKKATESVFLNLYNTLSEAPDPYPLLEATIDSLVSYSDVSKLNTENNRLKTTISRLNQQVSSLEASLATSRSDMKKKDDEIEREKAKVESQWKGILDEKTRNWEAKEKALGEKINDLEGMVGDLRASYEVAQKTGSGRDDEEGRSAGRFAELEMVSRDLERVSVRLAEVEHRNEELRSELANAKSDEGESVAAKELEEQKAEAARYHSENLSLLRKLELVQNRTEQDLKEHSRRAEKLERLLEGANADRVALKEKLAQFSDYEEIKRELEVLKTIELSTGDEEDDIMDFRNGESEEVSDDKKGQKKETLEQLLLARNKKLGSELTVLRVSHQDLSDKLQTLQAQLENTRNELDRANSLNERLEEDLAKLQSDPFSSAQSVAPSRYAPAQSVYGRGRVSPTSSIISGYAPQGSDTLPTGGAGILQMITAQRDRYKQKNTQLENEISKLNTHVVSLRQEIESLRKDNLQLYEKTRYVNSYAKQGNVASAYSQSSSGFSASTSQTIDRYKQAYEANISPFQAFRGRESARAVRKMGLAERVIYGLTRVILANRISRNIFVAYCVSLHLLCFMMLYHGASSEITKNVTPVAEGVAADSNWREEAYPGGR